MVLEACEGAALARLELTLEQDVTNHACVAGDGLEREQPDPGQMGSLEIAVRATEELVPAADGERCDAVVDGGKDLGTLGREILGDQSLLPVLPAADVEEIGSAPDRCLHAHRFDDQLVSAPGRTLSEHGDVAAIGVDVEVVGIQMGDVDLHAARFQ